MHAAGVVADHAAEGAALVTGWVGAEGEVMFFGGVAKIVEDDSRLHARDAAGGIDFENPRHVPREIEDDGDIAALAGKRGASPAAEQRGSELAAEGDSGENVVDVAGKHDTDWDLAIVGTVGSVEGTGSGVETNVAGRAAANLGAQGFFEPRSVDLR
jgi:hypothetical protein